MRLASAADFYDGPQYSAYRHHPGYRKRALLFRHFPEPLLIIGCGFGFLIDEFRALNKLAWGIDASPYALANHANNYVRQGDILNLSTLTLGEFATVITEDLLPCLTDDETLIAARNCETLASIVIHMVTERGQAAELNYHSTAEWMRLTNQLTISLEGM